MLSTPEILTWLTFVTLLFIQNETFQLPDITNLDKMLSPQAPMPVPFLIQGIDNLQKLFKYN